MITNGMCHYSKKKIDFDIKMLVKKNEYKHWLHINGLICTQKNTLNFKLCFYTFGIILNEHFVKMHK